MSRPRVAVVVGVVLLVAAVIVGCSAPSEPTSLAAVWRPGEPRIAVRQVKLPGPERGGFRFAIW
jgi:hypothetical protein